MFCRNCLGQSRDGPDDPRVDGLWHVLQEQLLVVRLDVSALDLTDPGHGVVDAQVLDDSRDDHAGTAGTPSTVDQTVLAL